MPETIKDIIFIDMPENRIKKMFGNIFTRNSVAKQQLLSVNVAPTNGFGMAYGSLSSTLSTSQSMRLSTVYRCVEVISDAIASQLWNISEFKNGVWIKQEISDLSYMLNYAPHVSMGRYMMMKTLVARTLLQGNGYLRIIRNKLGDPISLELVSNNVTIYQREDKSLYYSYTDTQGIEMVVEDEDMIHILNFTYDGINGVSTLTHADNSVTLSDSAEKTAYGFFHSGSNMSGIINSEGKITKEGAAAIKKSWSEAFNTATGGTPGGIAVMEGGLKFTPVTVNPKDAQMLETRQFNVVEICRFFGVSPSKVFDSANLTYSNIESFQLGFLTDTISPFDSKIENEFIRKLLRPSLRKTTRLNLDINILLRANMDAKANYYTKMFQLGVYNTNEIRREIGQPIIDGGDTSYVQTNLYPIDMIRDILTANIQSKQPKQ